MLKAVPILASTIVKDLGLALRRKRRNFLLYCAAGLSLATTYVSCVAALVVYLQATSSPLAAWLVTAAIFSGIALMIIAGVLILNHHEEKQLRKNIATKKLAATAAMTTIPRILDSDKVSLIAVAAIGAALAYAQANSSEQFETE